MIPNIALLIKLQEIDSKIDKLNQEKISIPTLIEAAKIEFNTEQEASNILKKQLTAKQLEKKNLELDLAKIEEKIDKYNLELNSVKSNEVYKNVLEVIKNEKQRQSDLEDKILVDFDDLDSLLESVNAEKTKLAEIEKKYEDQKNTLELRTQEIDQEIIQLNDGRSNAVSDINNISLVSIYDKVRAHRNGFTLVKVRQESSSCSGCNMHLPPQKIADIQVSSQPILCDNCNRILYLEPENQ